MFFVRFLLFSILLYNTGARTIEGTAPTLGTNAKSTATAVPVENTASTNLTETNDESRSFNNETRSYEPVTGLDKTQTLTPTEPKHIYNETVASEYKLPPTTDKDNWYVDTVPAEVLISTDNETATATSTRRPYYTYWGNGIENSRNINAFTVINATARTPYYSYWGNRLENSTKTTAATEDSKPTTNTTARTPYYSYWGNGLENSTKTTAATEDSEATLTRRSYYSYWGNESESETTASKSYYNWDNRTTTGTDKQPANVTETPSDDDIGYGYLTVENGMLTAHFPDSLEEDNNTNHFFDGSIEKSTTTGRAYTNTIPGFWRNETSSRYAGGIQYKQTTPFVYDTTETTTTQNIIIDPHWPTWSRSPDNSMNSSINTNETSNYGAVVDFLKKLSGTVLPSTGIKRSNSNITNLAITNENGNMFFYMNNYF